MAEYTADSVREAFDLDYETDYDFVGKQEFVRLKWRPKGKRGRWSKINAHKSEVHPTLGDLVIHRADYVAAWLNMREKATTS